MKHEKEVCHHDHSLSKGWSVYGSIKLL